MSAKTLPRLLNRKALAEELGITLSAAEAIMRQVPKVKVGTRVFVREPDVRRHLRKVTSQTSNRSSRSKTAERARLVLEDAPKDAAQLDSTPFTSRGVGEAMGNMLAMIGALAQCVVELTEAEDARNL